ncbi:hypothetical protein [Limnohabitans sp.]|uniref:hypothetical protein n=1 Tax=Limnohabitans sp. TaxID=1907725 RepID=UPI00286EDDFC|nr:hypothetical protein [Limnohabitans sp.]
MELSAQLQLIDLIRVTAPSIVAVLGTLAGGFLGHRYASIQTRTAKAIEFKQQRLREFYSPMVGHLHRVRALSNLRVEISTASDVAWQKICERQPMPFLDHEKYFAPFKAAIEYDNTQLYAEILPTYDKMVETFTSNYWLASSAVQSHYSELCRFVELWHRYKGQSIPMETLEELEHTEVRLQPLYELLESELSSIRSEVADENGA